MGWIKSQNASSAFILEICVLALFVTSVLAQGGSSVGYSEVESQGPETDNQKNLLTDLFNKFSTSYVKYNELQELLKQLESTFPNLVHIYSVGQSVRKKELYVIHISSNVTGERVLLKPMVKIVANMHGDETLGRSLTLMLAVKLLQGYLESNSR